MSAGPEASQWHGGKWHSTPHPNQGITGCGREIYEWDDDWFTKPLSQVPEADRCRTCWPTTKETRDA